MAVNRIRELREAANMTLDALASLIGTTNQQISHLELGKRRLTLDWMEKIAAALGCHPWSLVSSDDVASVTAEEQTILQLVRRLRPSDRRHLIDQLSADLRDKAS